MSSFERRGAQGHGQGTESDGGGAWPGKSPLTAKLGPIQRKAGPNAGAGAAAVAAGGLQAQGSAGTSAALPASLRSRMEGALGADFSAVQVFASSELPAAVGARAFARGNELHFAAGQYDPGSSAGQELIGHELTHVVQQRQGRVAATQQHKGAGAAAINDDASLEAEADAMGAKAAHGPGAGGASGPAHGTAPAGGAASAGGVMQLKRGEATSIAAARTFAVPGVTAIARIPDPTVRNQAINTSYHQIGAAMTGYLGPPLVANWFTFGQHASREAGTQIRNLQAGLGAMTDMLGILRTFVLSGADPITMLTEAGRMIAVVRRLLGLITQDPLIRQAAQLALATANISIGQLQQLVTDYDAVVAMDWVAVLIPAVRAARLAQFMGHLGVVVGGLIAAIPGLIQSLQVVFDNMVTGNRSIYENVAPAAQQFLAAASAAPDGVPGPMGFAGDPSGFMAAAFRAYAQVRRLGDEAATMPDTPEAAAKLAERQGLAQHANLLIGFQEQLIILQPIFDTMQRELAAMSGTMTLTDPNGTHPLANNWGSFYTRMGIDPATAPADPRTITPDRLPPLVSPGDPRRRGTISEYFNDNVTDDNIHSAPRSIAPM